MILVRVAFAAAVCLLIGACGEGNPPPPPPVPPVTPLPNVFEFTVDAGAWAIRYSPGMPANPSPDAVGWAVSLPVYAHTPTTDCINDAACASLHYVVTAVPGPITGASLNAVIAIDESRSPPPVYQPLLAPDNNCLPAIGRYHLFVQRAGDDMTLARGPSYRFWSPGFELKAGEVQISALFAGAWTNVSGQSDPVGLAALLANPAAVGVTFGGGCFAGHGINLGSGSSRFNLKRMWTQ